MMQTKPTHFRMYKYMCLCLSIDSMDIHTCIYPLSYIYVCIYISIQTLPLQFLLCRQSWQFFVQGESMNEGFCIFLEVSMKTGLY